jgi:hypothetical protein
MQRKAFNFFASYFEVARELSDKDRLAFYDALILEQFTGVKTELQGMAKFAYLSQRHSIDAQINGFNQRLKRGDTDLQPLSEPAPMAGGSVGANLQEKEKEKEEVQYVLPPKPPTSKKPKVNKITFENCDLFDKHKFAETFKGWSVEKLRYYYDAAHRYSIEGNKYVSWELAIKTWERKDAAKGMTYAPIESEMTQAEINKQKERDFYARL